ncbi:uncharacterized protein LOC129910861 [Episyrphus balteatus]|uniref:uncharacterized protein LOC129910861 n=1 Tax=Episyrphus balteatus TaxID=286459 RepID=UPI0024867E37|nr:uncharacterized protein LOC129910861 [Episyrphus balteatus]
MFKAILLACLLAIATANPVLYQAAYQPAYQPAYYAGVSPNLPIALPLAYAKLSAPAASETYNSVATANSFQQQYRSDYKPLTYSAGLIY